MLTSTTPEELFDILIESIKKYHPSDDLSMVRQASVNETYDKCRRFYCHAERKGENHYGKTCIKDRFIKRGSGRL